MKYTIRFFALIGVRKVQEIYSFSTHYATALFDTNATYFAGLLVSERWSGKCSYEIKSSPPFETPTTAEKNKK